MRLGELFIRCVRLRQRFRHQVVALLPHPLALLVHLQPEPAQDVVHQELDGPARREELVDDGDVVGRLRLTALPDRPFSRALYNW